MRWLRTRLRSSLHRRRFTGPVKSTNDGVAFIQTSSSRWRRRQHEMGPLVNHQRELTEFYEKADLDDAYERQWGYGNSVAAEYWGMRDQLVFGAISEKFGKLDNIRALEVGTGYGHELAKLRRIGIAWESLTGIDFLLPRL